MTEVVAQELAPSIATEAPIPAEPAPTAEELLAATKRDLDSLNEFTFKLQDMLGNCVRHMIREGTDKHLTKSVKEWFAIYEPDYQARNADQEKAEVIKAFEAQQKKELADLKYRLFGKNS